MKGARIMTVKVFYRNTKTLKTTINDVDFIKYNKEGETILVRNSKNSIILGKDLYDIEVWCSNRYTV